MNELTQLDIELFIRKKYSSVDLVGMDQFVKDVGSINTYYYGSIWIKRQSRVDRIPVIVMVTRTKTKWLLILAHCTNI